MITLHTFGSDRENERAMEMAATILDAWPHADEPDNGIKIDIISGMRMFGQKREDVDMIVAGQLERPESYRQRTPIPNTDGESIFAKHGDVKSFFLLMENKGHKNVSWKGVRPVVEYPTGPSDVTTQSRETFESFKDYCRSIGVKRIPTVTEIINLHEIEEHRIPPRPHNVIGKDADWHMILSTAACSQKLLRTSDDPPVLDALAKGGNIQEIVDLVTKDPHSVSRKLAPGELKPQQPEIGPTDVMTEIALSHARHQVISTNAVLSGITQALPFDDQTKQKMHQHMGKIAQGYGRLAARPALDLDAREADMKDVLETTRTGVRFLRGAIYTNGLQDTEMKRVKLLFRREESLDSASHSIDAAAADRSGLPGPVKDTKAIRHIMDYRLPGVSVDAGEVVAWEGLRTLQATTMHDPLSAGRVNKMAQSLCKINETTDERKRTEMLLATLDGVEESLSKTRVAHKMLEAHITTTLDNVRFVGDWMRAAGEGRSIPVDTIRPTQPKTKRTPIRSQPGSYPRAQAER